MLIKPSPHSPDRQGVTSELKVQLPEDLVAQAEGQFESGDCQPVETAICYGATPLLMGDVLEHASLDELLSLLGSYFSAVAGLQFQAGSLLQARQVLKFHLAAGQAEHRLRERLRREEADRASRDV